MKEAKEVKVVESRKILLSRCAKLKTRFFVSFLSFSHVCLRSLELSRGTEELPTFEARWVRSESELFLLSLLPLTHLTSNQQWVSQSAA